jgi:hypothetical protein
MKTNIWISYDLGIKGDYSGLYRWLDIHKSKECGTSTAFLNYEFKKDLISELTQDLKSNIEFKSGDRIYLITNIPKETDEKGIGGKFIIGNRKASPWEGYAPVEDNSFDA